MKTQGKTIFDVVLAEPKRRRSNKMQRRKRDNFY
jgi:hypothetical protein